MPQIRLLGALFFLWGFLPGAEPHGRLIEPPSRASAWRYGFSTPPNYNDHELYCGGFSRQWQKNGGKCGVCGDPYDSPQPRAHEFGGAYGQGVIVRKYSPKSVITIRIELTASHFGYFIFSICQNYKNTTQECLDKNILSLVRSIDQGGQKFYPRDGNKIYEMRYRLPELSCEHCILQWRYIAGNNWGNCPNGTGMVGCGPQEEFRACADISISGKIPTTTETTLETTTQVLEPPKDEFKYTPLFSIIISIVALVFTVLLLAILYIYYYEVGRRIKSCLKVGNREKGDKGEKEAPVPPPRIKRKAPEPSDNLYNVSLDLESNA